ncbi:aldose epimerase [Kaistia algarum]|uniref:aldose 1-epimerase n=1 Tax=Kaistia algarum TaxID=2083279 RepID=UPI000CE7A51D|nr:aldose 1-epimerase [Kaistia algarum]MCX5513921.1 aldose 1-epimerase [Kaistia algarum]PPE77552.1 aldose epimerase [Kaistia algarum]
MAATRILSAGPLTATIQPSLGGSVTRFTCQGAAGPIDLMRPLSTEAAAAADVLGAAMFPMLPYANLIENNAFDFGGRTWRFKANFPPMRDTTHGSGWLSRWSVIAETATRLVIELRDDEIGSPYRFLARQAFQLTPERFAVTIELTNLGPVAMPFGFGLHPWFIRTPQTRLRYHAETVWLEGYDGMPTEAIRVPPELDFDQPTRLPDARRNLCYGGWDGAAQIEWPEWRQGLRVEADPVFRHLMLYTPRGAPHFCIEPQTNASGAFNRLGEASADSLGVIVLKPGQKASGTTRFSPVELT